MPKKGQAHAKCLGSCPPTPCTAIPWAHSSAGRCSPVRSSVPPEGRSCFLPWPQARLLALVPTSRLGLSRHHPHPPPTSPPPTPHSSSGSPSEQAHAPSSDPWWKCPQAQGCCALGPGPHCRRPTRSGLCGGRGGHGGTRCCVPLTSRRGRLVTVLQETHPTPTNRSLMPSVEQNKAPEVTASSYQYPWGAGLSWGSGTVGNCGSVVASRKGEVLKYRLWISTSECSPRPPTPPTQV